MYCTRMMNQESDGESCVVKWDSDVGDYESLVGITDCPTMTQEVEAIMLEQGSKDGSSSDSNDSSSSDNSDDNVISTKRVIET